MSPSLLPSVPTYVSKKGLQPSLYSTEDAEQTCHSIGFSRWCMTFECAQFSDIIKCVKEMLVVCSYGTNPWHTITCTSKLTSVSISHKNKFLCLLQAGISHVVICHDLWKKVCMSDISCDCPVCTGAILIVSAHQSTYKAESLSQSIINSI